MTTPPVKYFKGGLTDLQALFDSVKSYIGVVVGYRVSGDTVGFDSVESLESLPLSLEDVQAPGVYRLSRSSSGFFRHSHASPKYWLHLPIQEVFSVLEDYTVNVVRYDTRSAALFGIKPCDLASIEVLDRILKDDDSYWSRRSKIELIVVEECTVPGATCFCGSIGTGPFASAGFDIAYARLNNGIIFKYGSEKGLKILERLKLAEASKDDVTEYERAIARARELTRYLPPPSEVSKSLERSIGDISFWKEVSSRCVGCTNCNMVCPTCFCSEFVDQIEPSGRAKRVRQWFGCLSYTYGQVAGIHYRPELYMRYRHFVLHKFLFYPKQVGLVGCVGCGRCITWCPMGIDLREVISKAVSRYGS